MNVYTRQVNCERWPVDRPHGWNASLTDPGPMHGKRRGEVKVVSVETGSQPDAGWLAATYKSNFFLDFSDAASFNEYGSEGMNDGMSDGNSEHASSADEDSQLRYRRQRVPMH